MKLTKTQTANLNRIATESVAFTTYNATTDHVSLITAAECLAAGYVKMHANTADSLINKGLARVITTEVTTGGGYMVQTLILTAAGWAAIGA